MSTENMACVDCFFSQTSGVLEGGDVYCKRYPEPVVKSASDWCGEYKQRPPKHPPLPTMQELRNALAKEIARIEKNLDPNRENAMKAVMLARKYMMPDSGKDERAFNSAISVLRRYR
jgi:hypothetical protein